MRLKKGAIRERPRCKCPIEIDGVVNRGVDKAIVSTIAEREEKTLVREDRGTSARVFTVGGNRRNERPEENSNGAEDEVSDPITGRGRHNSRVE